MANNDVIDKSCHIYESLGSIISDIGADSRFVLEIDLAGALGYERRMRNACDCVSTSYSNIVR